ncbi:MAG: endolytic transglycosylase MltG [Oscillospiraceae bacterium]|nr:endolytic transglycosylase MltG [Oscillospiraceae bacterium]
MIYKTQDGQYDNRRRRRREYQRRRGWIGWLIALIIIGVVAYAVNYGYKYIKSDVEGTNGVDTPIIIDIPYEATSDMISELLEEYGIVANKFIFRNYLRFFYAKTPHFMYGPHELRSNMSYEEIIPVLEQPMLDLRETITLQFIDGWTTLRMGMYLEEMGICSIDEWLEACNDVYDVSFYEKISSNPEKFTKLEGFLFPDTYEFYEDVTQYEIVQKMLETFEEKILQDPVLSIQIELNNMSLEDIVRLASIVEKETGDLDEIYKVSSVFHNRLSKSSPLPSLQSCATQKYTVGVLDYYYIELRGFEGTPYEMEYAYDTYLCEGLMVGAICNPSKISISATLNPEDTPYYYFLMDDTGKTYYGTTYKEHQENINQMRAANAQVASGAGDMS